MTALQAFERGKSNHGRWDLEDFADFNTEGFTGVKSIDLRVKNGNWELGIGVEGSGLHWSCQAFFSVGREAVRER